MSYGSFNAVRKNLPAKEKKDAPPKPVPNCNATVAPPQKSTSILTVNVLLIGRNLSIMQEFLSSANVNINDILQTNGLTYYTKELESISKIVDKKKSAERFFWEPGKSEWRYNSEHDASQVYTFNISPSGIQEKEITLNFHCCPYDNQPSLSPQSADAIWFVGDSIIFDDDKMYDPYKSYLSQALCGLSENDSKPICLILSQIEKYTHFNQIGSVCLLPTNDNKMLLEKCREMFAGVNANVAVIPVQVFGGLEYVGTDEYLNPVLKLCDNGYYQVYMPEECYMPLFYTLNFIMALNQCDCFAELSGKSLRSAIRNSYSTKKDDINWKPDMLVQLEES